jgi:hypothetical protein
MTNGFDEMILNMTETATEPEDYTGGGLQRDRQPLPQRQAADRNHQPHAGRIAAPAGHRPRPDL